MYELNIAQLKSIEQAISNNVFFSPKTFNGLRQLNAGKDPVYVKIKEGVFKAAPSDHIDDTSIAMNKKQREFLRLSTTVDKAVVSVFKLPSSEYRLGLVKVEVLPLKLESPKELEDKAFEKLFTTLYTGQFFNDGMEVYFEIEGLAVYAKIMTTTIIDSDAKREPLPYGMICSDTQFEFASRGNTNLRIKGSSNTAKAIFRPDFKFEDLDVGGLDKEIADIFRRAFSSRRIPTHLLQLYNIKHVKGLLLYGPPGTGKTLIARQLGKVLHAKEPKIVNGPELFNKYVGETESNMRKLFEDAKKDWINLKEESPLHIIIFDEFDAIAKTRGMDSSGTGVADNVVNQLLSIIDGVESLDNILVIGMTNRLDLIDRAVLRPGRFEVHVEIGLPDEKGRAQILKIHTKQMAKNNLLGSDVSLEEIAANTKNYTGAELEAVVKAAASWSLNRNHNLMNFSEKIKITNPGKVDKQDFEKALNEIKPEFGVEEDKLNSFLSNPLILYSSRFNVICQDLAKTLNEAFEGRSNNISILLHGPQGTGTTTIAVHAATRLKFPFIKMISAEDLIGKTENFKSNFLVKCFDDAYKSKRSLIILDDIERICEFVDVGKRVNNLLLQAVSVLCSKVPRKPDHTIAIIGTSSNITFMREFGLISSFNVRIEVPELSFNSNGENEILNVIQKQTKIVPSDKYLGQPPNFRIGIKKLLFVLNLVLKSGQGRNFEESFREAIRLAGNDQFDDLTTNY